MKKALLLLGAILISFFGLTGVAQASDFPQYISVSWLEPVGSVWPQTLYAGDPTCGRTLQNDHYEIRNQRQLTSLRNLIAHGVLNAPGTGSWTDTGFHRTWTFTELPACVVKTTPTTPTSSTVQTTPTTKTTASTPTTPSTTKTCDIGEYTDLPKCVTISSTPSTTIVLTCGTKYQELPPCATSSSLVKTTPSHPSTKSSTQTAPTTKLLTKTPLSSSKTYSSQNITSSTNSEQIVVTSTQSSDQPLVTSLASTGSGRWVAPTTLIALGVALLGFAMVWFASRKRTVRNH